MNQTDFYDNLFFKVKLCFPYSREVQNAQIHKRNNADVNVILHKNTGANCLLRTCICIGVITTLTIISSLLFLLFTCNITINWWDTSKNICSTEVETSTTTQNTTTVETTTTTTTVETSIYSAGILY